MTKLDSIVTMITLCRRTIGAVLITASIFSAPTVRAGQSQTTVTVSVTVLAVPCHINGDANTPTVEFGDVRADLIDGSRYAQPLEVKITCDSTPSGDLQYELKGDAAAFDSKVLKTETSGLGIKILKADGSMLAVNTWTGTARDQTVNLKAVPVRDTTAKLTGGEFNATATLILQMK
ncbi:fimbrial protein [Enterobacter hormaechei]|uniref:fimbrial protein n=1 Tax=Enterobacter hormaechei TaxID=158836 RepID=UPI003F41E454